VLGGVGAIGMFLTTLSFLFTTPGTLMPQGFPFSSGDVGEFLIKDIALLAHRRPVIERDHTPNHPIRVCFLFF
jgi:uncharacterized membrane protein YkgB